MCMVVMECWWASSCSFLWDSWCVSPCAAKTCHEMQIQKGNKNGTPTNNPGQHSPASRHIRYILHHQTLLVFMHARTQVCMYARTHACTHRWTRCFLPSYYCPRERHSTHTSPLNFDLTLAIACLPKVGSKFWVESGFECHLQQPFCKTLFPLNCTYWWG